MAATHLAIAGDMEQYMGMYVQYVDSWAVSIVIYTDLEWYIQ